MIPRARLWLLLRFALVPAALIILFFSGIFPVEDWLAKLYPQGLSASVAAYDVASLTNEQRTENGLPPLSVSPLLSEAAQLKANDMAQYSYYAHTGPDGKTPLSWLSQVGYKYLNAGENLVIDRTSASEAVGAWMNSPEHRDNILRPQFTEIGVGVAEGEYEGVSTIFVVEEFGTPYPTYTAARPKAVQPKVAVTAQPAQAATVAVPQQTQTVTTQPAEQPAAAPVNAAIIVPKAASLPKVATLAQLAPVKPSVTTRAKPLSTTGQKTESPVSASSSSVYSAENVPAVSTSSTVAFALAPEFFKPVTIPKGEGDQAAPAAPQGASATRLSSWLSSIQTFIRSIFK